jgi:hypothetical protein
MNDGLSAAVRPPYSHSAVILRGHENDVQSVAFNPDGQMTPDQRVQFLAESPSDARVAHAACEGRHGRKAEVRVQN